MVLVHKSMQKVLTDMLQRACACARRWHEMRVCFFDTVYTLKHGLNRSKPRAYQFRMCESGSFAMRKVYSR